MRLSRSRLAAIALALALTACGSSAEEQCNHYLTDLADVVEPAGDALATRADEFRSLREGEIALDQLASVLAQSADEVAVVLTDIKFLGDPPPSLADGVELIVAGFTELGEAFGLDPLGLATDPEMLDQYGVSTQEGVTLIEEGTKTLGSCEDG